MIKKHDLILSVISGALYPAAFMVPQAGVLSWFLLVPFFISIEKKSPWSALRLGTLMGTIANTIGTYWIIGTLSRFGGFPLAVSALFHLVLSTYSGLSIGLFAYVTTRLHLFEKGGLISALVIAAVWTSVEFLFPYLFPYGITNSQASYTPLIQIFDLFGMYSLSFLIVLVNVTLVRLLKRFLENTRTPSLEIAASLILLTLVIVYGLLKVDVENKKIVEAPKIKVGIVQANFDFFEKNENNEDEISKRHISMSGALGSPDLIVWPETAIQAWIPASSDLLADDGKTVIPHIEGSYFLVGGLSYSIRKSGTDGSISDADIEKFNTAFLTDSGGRILGRYHKIKLLLFGEYLPFTRYIPALKKLSPASGDFTPGNKLDLFEIREKGLRIAPLICYEDIIPSFSRRFVKEGANLIVNITNDAWFGRTTAPYQHLLLSIPRAVETRRYLVRATNTGVSAIIDPVGRVVAKTEIFKPVTLEGEIGIMNGEKTLYTKTGDVFSWGCLAFWLGFGVVTRYLVSKPKIQK
ncbi:MAG TPA: apolipoprotein N-acyltransferase [Thermodesulfobacteriota bacterium]|nr:apolipoprotein N-acyltransferase [Thermodesulfobacteriota bacterium]